MTDQWLSGFDRVPGEGSGTWAGDNEDAPKIVLHTTEGVSIGGATAAFHQHRSWPHLTVDPVRRRRIQHVPLNIAARALRNTSAPGQTNREARVFQIEIVGTAHRRSTAQAGQTSVEAFTGEDLDWLGTAVLAPLAKATGCPLTTGVTFYGEDCGWTLATETAKQRLSAAAWDTYVGVLGHQHVPENTHWDPGPLDVPRILAAARRIILNPSTPTEDIDMTADELAKLIDEKLAPLAKDLAEVKRQVAVSDPGKPPDRKTRTLRHIVAADLNNGD